MEKENVGSSDEQGINYRGVKAMPFIIGNETFEKLGTIGTSANLTVYLTTVFNMKSVEAATLVNVLNGTTNMATLIGAFLSDSFLGRYKTLAFASISSLLGMTMITLTSAISNLHPPRCHQNQTTTPCTGPSNGQLAFLLAGFIFLVIGAGGIRPCNLAFGVDQFNPGTDSGKRGINSFFNWYYFTFTFAVMVAVTAIVYVQTKVSWTLGLAIPAFLMLVSCGLFFLGSKMYVKVKPQGSPLTSVAQVVAAAIKKRRLKLTENECAGLYDYFPPADFINSKLPRTDQFRLLDKAAIITTEDHINPDGSAYNPWTLCSTQQIEEVKCILRVIPIWASAIIYYVVIFQQHTYVVFQAFQSDRRLGNSKFVVPAASYSVIAMLTFAIWIPIYDRILIPFLRKMTGKESGITLLQRMGIGILLSILTMLVSGIIEGKRKDTAITRPTIGIAPKGGAVSSFSALWLIPQLTLVGLSEGFNTIGQVEFYYKQFPENMRSIAGSFFFCGMACSSYASGLLVWVVHHFTDKAGSTQDWLPDDLNKGKLDYFYYMIAAIGAANFGYFLLCAKWYRYKGAGGSTMEVEVALETKQPVKYLV